MLRLIAVILILHSLLVVCHSQSSSQLGVLPALNFNKKLPNDWSLNFKVESRQSIYTDQLDYDYILTDHSIAGVKKVGLNAKAVVGYLIRLDNENKHRLFQQISFVKNTFNLKIGHRIATDQTFDSTGDTEFRIRYRISTEIPLNGTSLDVEEFYLKLNNEYLNSLQGRDYDLEIRAGGFIGHVINPDTKLELGVDYRGDSFIESQLRNRFWIGVNVYVSF